MKKTLCFALGAMFMLMLPGRGVEAQQTVPVNLTVMTLDRATITTARIYSGNTGVNYFVDSLNLSDNFTGTAVCIDSLPYTELAIENGYTITGDVDTSYHISFVIAKDANNRFYVLGAGDTLYPYGVFQATQQLGSGNLNNLGYPLTVNHILLGNNAVIEDDVLSRTSITDSTGWFYSSLQSATYWASFAQGINMLTFIDNVTLNGASSVEINNSLTINQNGKNITNLLAVPAITINNSDVSWEGGNGTVTSTINTDGLFELNNSSLLIRNVADTAGTYVAKLNNNSFFSANTCHLRTLSDTASVIYVGEDSRVEISSAILSGMTGSKAISITGATSTVDVYETTLNSLPIYAYGRVQRTNGHIMYSRDLNIAADSARGDTVYLNMDYTGTTPQTVATAAVVQLGNHNLNSLYVGHPSGTMEILGGKVNTLIGTSGTAPMTLSIDSLGYLSVASHPTTIVDGRYVNFTNPSGDPISIEGGKYATRYDSYIANRHFFIENADADAAQFPWAVGTGYHVTWKRWDYINDTTILYNTDNDLIDPILSIPSRFVGTDTTFIAWWADSLFTTPWDFDNDVLTSDTTLYAEWHIVDTTEVYYTIRHVRIGIDNQDSIVDSLSRYALIGSTITVYALSYPFYTPVENSISITVDTNAENIATIHYVRDTFHLVWNLMGGHFADNSSLNEYLAWGQPIDYSRVPIRRGYSFVGWQNNVTVMPQHDHAITAMWERNTYSVVWNIPSSIVTYNAEPVTGIYATYTHEEGTDTAILRYTDIATGISTEQARNAGVYKIIAVAQSPEFFLDTNTTSNDLTILKAGISASGWEVEHAKFYDGDDTATITTLATLNAIGNDDVILANFSAHFSDATVGEGKSIMVYYDIAGDDATNYILDTNMYLAAIDGAILAPYIFEDTAAHGIAVDAFGYCAGNNTIRYFLQSGTPDQYKLIFSDEAQAQNFANVDWTALDATNPGAITFDVPADAAYGLYTVKVLFGYSAYPNMTSDTITVGFTVSLPKTYTMPLFSDVIALVDTCHCFTDIHWFHSTDGGATWNEVTEAANKYYYQEVGGLTGEYRVQAKMNGMVLASCPQDDITTLIADEGASAKVSVYPNPTTDRASVTISNSRNDIHTLRVMSVMGVEMVNTTFYGDNCQLDFSSYANGSYTVSVDGTVVRIIKK